MPEHTELLEDPDGCPYPDEVQTLWQYLVETNPDITPEPVVEALESVARAAFKQGQRA